MKKRFLLVLLLIILPFGLFADFGIGGAVFYNSPVLIGQEVDTSGIGLSDFTFGANARYKFSFLQLDGLVLLTLGDNAVADAFLDVEACLDLLMLRLSAGLGPNLSYNFSDGGMETGFNAKANVDLKLGKISLGLSYIMALNLDGGIALDKSTGLLGATILLW